MVQLVGVDGIKVVTENYEDEQELVIADYLGNRLSPHLATTLTVSMAELNAGVKDWVNKGQDGIRRNQN